MFDLPPQHFDQPKTEVEFNLNQEQKFSNYLAIEVSDIIEIFEGEIAAATTPDEKNTSTVLDGTAIEPMPAEETAMTIEPAIEPMPAEAGTAITEAGTESAIEPMPVGDGTAIEPMPAEETAITIEPAIEPTPVIDGIDPIINLGAPEVYGDGTAIEPMPAEETAITIEPAIEPTPIIDGIDPIINLGAPEEYVVETSTTDGTSVKPDGTAITSDGSITDDGIAISPVETDPLIGAPEGLATDDGTAVTPDGTDPLLGAPEVYVDGTTTGGGVETAEITTDGTDPLIGAPIVYGDGTIVIDSLDPVIINPEDNDSLPVVDATVEPIVTPLPTTPEPEVYVDEATVIKTTGNAFLDYAIQVKSQFEDGLQWKDIATVIELSADLLSDLIDVRLIRNGVITIIDLVIDLTDVPYVPDAFVDPVFKMLIHPFVNLAFNLFEGRASLSDISLWEKGLIKSSNLTQDDLRLFADGICEVFADGFQWSDLAEIVSLSIEFLSGFSDLTLQEMHYCVIDIMNFVLDATDTPFVPDAIVDPLIKEFIPPLVKFLINRSN